MGDNKYYFFYSNYCEHCKDYKVKLTKAGLLNTFNAVCVDNRNIKLPRNLTGVPAIIVPEYKDPLEMDDAFAWLNSIVNKKTKNDTIEPFFFNEMGGFSDKYSDLSDATPMSHSFSYIGQDGNTGIPTPVDDGGNNSSMSTKRKEEMEAQYEKLKQMRDMDVRRDIASQRH